MSKFLDRESILRRTALPSQEIAVPEWDGIVRIRCMTVGEREQFEVVVGTNKQKNMRELLAVFCICDEEGTRIFTLDDIEYVSTLEAKALDRIFAAAVVLNGIGRDDIAELKKNSGTTR